MPAQKSPAPNNFILASASPRRAELLKQIGITPKTIIPANIDETPDPREAPRAYVQRMATSKAEAIAKQHPKTAILAADTIVTVGRRILGKPSTRDHAEKMLKLLSGRRHQVLTAITLKTPDGKTRNRIVTSKLRLKRLDEATIKYYLDSNEWKDKAGAYAIQGIAALWIDWISGSYSNIVGLPLAETGQLLKSAGLLKTTERRGATAERGGAN